MTTTIESNGSNWAGEDPDSIECLLAVLATHPLDRMFEGYGNFILPMPESRVGAVRFWGNFAELSHVFSITTDEPETIATLTAAIRANQASAAYLAAPSFEQRQAAAEAERTAREAVRATDRRARLNAELAALAPIAK